MADISSRGDAPAAMPQFRDDARHDFARAPASPVWTEAKRWMGRAWMRAFGWRVEGELPPEKCVIIAAPHTSNWDFPFMLAAAYVIGFRISWMGKHTLFKGPFGPLMRRLGGIAVDRRAPQNLVQQVAERFAQSDELVLAVPPEGTRKKVEYWKSGFYQIARGARVPVVLGFLDFERKVGGLGPVLMPTQDARADMDRIRAYYRDIRGKRPTLESTPRLREEDAPRPLTAR
jgi:1-acyl-sn-glycerol-3-phosphate acyltransferase